MGFDYTCLSNKWLEMPGDWRVLTVGDVAAINELSIKSGYLHETVEYIDIASVQKGIIHSVQVLPLNDAPSRAKRIVRDNDTLISTVRPNLEHYVFIKRAKPNTIASTGFAVVTAKDAAPRYLYYYLTTKSFTAYLSQIADSHTSAYPAINPDVIETAELLLPPLPEQRAIAHILGTLDDKIELNHRMNQTLEAMAQALFKSWFVDFEPFRAQGMQDSPLGEIPVGWEISSIGNEVAVVGGSTPSTKEKSYWDGGIHCWATPKDLSISQNPILLDTERRITDAGLATIASGLLPAGTVLLSSRAPIGYIAISAVPVAINQGFIAVVCNKRLSNYLVFLWTKHNLEIIKGRANGTTFPEMSKRDFRPMNIIVPANTVSENFDRIVTPIFKRIENNMKEFETISSLRDTLLPKLLSGEIRVKDAEKFVEKVL
ncbi:MAG: restriction endonuclease subunit S [Dehalococcoidia bacterium]